MVYLLEMAFVCVGENPPCRIIHSVRAGIVIAITDRAACLKGPREGVNDPYFTQIQLILR